MVATYGVISAGGIRYCLISDDRTQVQDVPLFESGPSARTFGYDERTREVKTPRGDRMSATRVLIEAELWTPGKLLVMIGSGPGRHFPVCPLSLEFLKQPAELVAQVLAQLSVDMNGDEAVFHLSWDGIFIQRKYNVAILPVGVAVWPPKEVPDWKPHFLLFGPGTKEASTAPFKRFVPVVHEAAEGWPTGERKVYEAGYLAMVRTEHPPRLVGFVDQQSKDQSALGFALMAGAGTDFSFFGFQDWAQRALLAERATSRTSPETLRVAIDFGTSNTAVAVQGGDESPRLLSFDRAGSATAPTAGLGLEPYAFANAPFRFFPLGTQYANPLPTMLLDIAPTTPEATLFARSNSLPRFVIPPPRPLLDENSVQDFCHEKILKQDFKWQGDDADVLRLAFLEQFAMVVAYQLRSERAAIPQRLAITGSYPLAYTNQQHARLIGAFNKVIDVFKDGGFAAVDLVELISESYANYRFIDDTYRDLHRTETGRLLVVDIGGGTTDISVSTERGKVLFLDSLMIGGKDLSQKLLPYRIFEQGRSDQVLKALGLKTQPRGRDDKAWCDGVQYLLLKRMKEGEGVPQLGNHLHQHGMGDLLGELLALLTFATVYGARLALQPDPSKVKRLTVKFGGLGSRLFDMAPIAPPAAKSWDAAKRVILAVIKGLPEAADVAVDIGRFSEPKEAVCLGTALAKDTDAGGDARVKLRTIWWSDISRRERPAIAWNDPFGSGLSAHFTDDEIDGVEVKPLLELIEGSLAKVGEATFEEGWRPKGEVLDHLRTKVTGLYRNGCSRLTHDLGSGKLTHWPIRQVTEGLKEMVCGVIEG